MRIVALTLPFAVLPLTGCVAKSAFDLATLPMRAGAQAINTTAGVYDRVTVSQSEQDQKLGRKIRQREERYGRLSRDYDRARAECGRGEQDACDDARNLYRQLNELRASVPYERE